MKTSRYIFLIALFAGLSWSATLFRGVDSAETATRAPNSTDSKQNQLRDTKAEWNRFFDVVRERKIENPAPTVLLGLCNEGFSAACVDAGRSLLVQCHDELDEAQSETDQDKHDGRVKAANSVCEQANVLLMSSCTDGFIVACDAAFQAVEGKNLRDSIAGVVENFCSQKVPEACLTFEMALRNELDRFRDNPGAFDKKKIAVRRHRYVMISDQNCDEGHFFSCLSVLDEDPATADKKRIASAETRLNLICDRASDRFDKENCLWYAAYLATTNRQAEGLRFAKAACTLDSESGCFEVARIELSTHEGEMRGLAQLKHSCDLSSKNESLGAQRPNYCFTFQKLTKNGPLTWEQLRSQVAFSEGSRNVTFQSLMKLPVRETY